MTDRPVGPAVFAVEDDAVQVTWRDLPAGSWEVGVPGAEAPVAVAVDGDGGPGAVTVGGLPAASALSVELRPAGAGGGAGAPAAWSASFRTLAPPPGPLRCRVATLSDLHIGAHRAGVLPRVAEDPHREPAAVRCAAAALAEALAWGADVVVVKGDVCQESRPGEWAAAGRVLGASPVPVHVLAGNHDLGRRSRVPAREAAAAAGLAMVDGVALHDLPGVRLVMVDTTVPGHGHGRIGRHRDEVTAALAEARAAGRAAIVLTHHHLQRWAAPTFWPPGIPGPEARHFLDGVAAANPATLVTSGHTHRHRRRWHGPLVVTEVGATKDYPGTWAGYAVHDGGVRQVVRRIADPDAIRWTERVGETLLGIWARWSPGRLGDRCFTHRWPG